MHPVPEGFKLAAPRNRPNPFNQMVGPFYEKREGKAVSLGLYIEEKHTNSRGICHGGLLATMADLALGEAVEMLREAGHGELADDIDTDLVGRNILAGRWSFQVVEEYDDGYYAAFKEHERVAREQLMGGRRHVFEAEMKQDRRTHGRSGHAATPADGSSS